MNRTRAQTSFEAISLFATSAIILSIFMIYFGAQVSTQAEEREYQALLDVADLLQQEIALARQAGPGYERTIEIPSGSQSKRITFTLLYSEDANVSSEVLVRFDPPISESLEASDVLGAGVYGTFSGGTNTIRTYPGGIVVTPEVGEVDELLADAVIGVPEIETAFAYIEGETVQLIDDIECEYEVSNYWLFQSEDNRPGDENDYLMHSAWYVENETDTYCYQGQSRAYGSPLLLAQLAEFPDELLKGSNVSCRIVYNAQPALDVCSLSETYPDRVVESEKVTIVNSEPQLKGLSWIVPQGEDNSSARETVFNDVEISFFPDDIDPEDLVFNVSILLDGTNANLIECETCELTMIEEGVEDRLVFDLVFPWPEGAIKCSDLDPVVSFRIRAIEGDTNDTEYNVYEARLRDEKFCDGFVGGPDANFLDLNIIGTGDVYVRDSRGLYDARYSSDRSFELPFNAEVNLSAIDIGLYDFDFWAGDITGSATDPNQTVKIDGYKDLNVTFIEERYFIIVNVIGGGTYAFDPYEDVGYTNGTTVTVEAIPDPQWTFGSWGGDYDAGTENGRFVNVTLTQASGDRYVDATFIRLYNLSVESGFGGNVTFVGDAYDTTEYTVSPDTPRNVTYTTGTYVALTAVPEYTYEFVGWTGVDSASGTSDELGGVTIDAPESVVATFAKRTFDLSLTAQPGGSVTVSADGYPTEVVSGGESISRTYDMNTVVTLTAATDTGYLFTGWSGSATGGEPTTSVTIDGPESVTANFQLETFSVNVNTVGSGTVTKSPDAEVYEYGSTVTLTATPADGWMFHSWSGVDTQAGNEATVTVTSGRTVTATFIELASLAITIEPSGSGSVIVNPAQAEYAPGTTLSLTAQPASGWIFSGWSGAVSGSQETTSFDIISDTSVTASFTKLPTLTATVSPSGSGSINIDPNAPYYNFGTSVTLSASPTAGWQFDGWSGDSTSNSPTTSVTMDSSKSLTANFIALPQLSTQVLPSGSGTITINPDKPYYAFGESVSLTINPNTGFGLTSWSGDASGTTDTISVAMNRDKSVVANLAGLPVLTTSVTGQGSIARNPNKPYYDFDESVTLTANPASGWVFDRWEIDATGTSTSTSITMDSDKSVRAVFLPTYTLTTSRSPSVGSISLNPSGGTYVVGTRVTVTASVPSGYRFDRWSGDSTSTSRSITITMDSDKSLTANYIRQYRLTTSRSPSVGSISPSSGTYDAGTVVSLSASVPSGYRFDRWSGDASGTSTSTSVTMNSDKTAVANYVRQYRLTVRSSGAGRVSVSGKGTVYNGQTKSWLYDSGSTASLSAIPNTGYAFLGWGGALSGTGTSKSLTMNSDKSVTASFGNVAYRARSRMYDGNEQRTRAFTGTLSPGSSRDHSWSTGFSGVFGGYTCYTTIRVTNSNGNIQCSVRSVSDTAWFENCGSNIPLCARTN